MRKKLENTIKRACRKLYKKDKYLINVQACERAIVFRFGMYLQEIMNRDEVLKYYNLDNEYNRNMNDPKRIPYHIHGVFPDLIIHRRGSNEDNLLIIECKTEWNNETESDIKKIEHFINPKGEYKYTFGISIIFKRSEVIFRIIEAGHDYEWKFFTMK